MRLVEIQRSVATETVSRLTLDVPEAVLAQDDPDALTQWVELNVPEKAISDALESRSNSKVTVLSADLV